MPKLEYGQIHLLRLAERDANPEGWTVVADAIWPWVLKLPSDLVRLKTIDNIHYVKVTSDGKAVLRHS